MPSRISDALADAAGSADPMRREPRSLADTERVQEAINVSSRRGRMPNMMTRAHTSVSLLLPVRFPGPILPI